MFTRKASKFLDTWLSDQTRKPLIIRGARQVGKTCLIKSWAEKNFKNILHINLEDSKERSLFGSIRHADGTFEIEDCLRVLENFYLPSESRLTDNLIFFDEIQNMPGLISLLRFFYEKRPDLYLISAGSYLEIKLKQEAKHKDSAFTFPVGRVENLYLYPLDFFEYIAALGEDRLLNLLQEASWNSPPPPEIHLRASELFEQYFLYGGMPEIVQNYSAGTRGEKITRIYNSLMNGYMDDIHKYGLRESRVNHLRHLLQHCPAQTGHLIKYSGFASSAYGSREISAAFEILEDVLLLTLARACSDTGLPWNPAGKKQKKLIFLDIGLVNHEAGLSIAKIRRADLNQIHRGRCAEQVIGQQLISDQNYNRGRLTYWIKDYQQGRAEVDFCIESNGIPCAIEVKSGKAGSLKSIFEFARAIPESKLLRVYSGAMTAENHQGKILYSIPFYLIPRLRELAAMA